MTPYLLSLLYNLMVLRVSTNILLFNKYDYQIMARINIDTGVLGNAATGDTLRTAMTKINTNFTEVYSLIADGSSGLIATDVTNGDLKLQANGTGSIEIDTLSVQNSTITSITTNSDITINPNGTGNVVLGNFTFNADQTVGASEDNYVFTYDHSTGTIGLEASAAGDVTASSSTTFTNKTFDANGTGNSISNIDIADFTSGVFLDEDNMASNSATAIASQQSIKAYVDAEDANIASDTLTFTNKSGNISQWTNDSNYATQAYVDARDIGDLSVVGSTISAPSNADLTLTTSGTGSVSIEAIQIKGTELSSSDSTQITIKENLHVTGNITGTLTGSVAFSNVTSTPTTLAGYGITDAATLNNMAPTGAVDFTGATSIDFNTVTINNLEFADISAKPTTIAGYGITDAASATATALTVVGDDSSGTAVTLGETFKVAGATGITTAVSGDTLTITGPTLTSFITASSSDTLTNKTIDANGTGNSISNIEVADFAAASIVTAGEGIGSNNNDTTIPTSAAVKAYADSVGGGGASTGDITFTGSTIISPSNADITLDPSGTGGVVAQGPVTFNAGYIEKINTLTSSSTITVNCALASIHTVTLGTSTEFNITNLPTGGSLTLIITQDGTGNRTATFGTDGSSAVKFPSNSSTLSTGGGDIDVVTIINDGTNFLGNIAKDYRSS
jgi:hypothetical protein